MLLCIYIFSKGLVGFTALWGLVACRFYCLEASPRGSYLNDSLRYQKNIL
jgi:hypothetical protein